MSKGLWIIGGALVALASAPLAAQGRGMGAAPAMTSHGPPATTGSYARPSDYPGNSATYARSQIARDYLPEQPSAAERAELYRVSAQQRRGEAQAIAAAARSGTLRQSASEIRNALKKDMNAWRSAFEVSRSDWQMMRQQWLADRDSLTAAQWAQRRLDWMEARDTWIADQRVWASARQR